MKKEGKLDKYGRIVDKTPEAWKMLFGEPDKATTLSEVAKAVKPVEVEKKKKVECEDESSDEDTKKRDKKKEKKEKKDKKEK